MHASHSLKVSKSARIQSGVNFAFNAKRLVTTFWKQTVGKSKWDPVYQKAFRELLDAMPVECTSLSVQNIFPNILLILRNIVLKISIPPPEQWKK